MFFVRPPFVLKRMFRNAVWNIPSTEKKIYLTFDDGPVQQVTPFVLSTLKQFNAKATFFCVGENVSRNQTIYKSILEDGHSVGNHTFNHLNGWNTSPSNYLRNVLECGQLVKSNLFRPPYGKIKQKQWKLLDKSFKLIFWDVLSGDFDHSTTPEKCLKNVLDHTTSGSIVVFHDSERAFRNLEYVLPRTLEYFSRQGFSFEKIHFDQPSFADPVSSF